jgi:hypothetical protein
MMAESEEGKLLFSPEDVVFVPMVMVSSGNEGTLVDFVWHNELSLVGTALVLTTSSLLSSCHVLG